MSNFDDFINNVKFNDAGLVPVIAQDVENGQILMMAWMNAESLKMTLSTKKMCYFSRSRNSLWIKGETSGNTQKLVEMIADCDHDTLLAKIEQKGAACHTGVRSCFFNDAPL